MGARPRGFFKGLITKMALSLWVSETDWATSFLTLAQGLSEGRKAKSPNPLFTLLTMCSLHLPWDLLQDLALPCPWSTASAAPGHCCPFQQWPQHVWEAEMFLCRSAWPQRIHTHPHHTRVPLLLGSIPTFRPHFSPGRAGRELSSQHNYSVKQTTLSFLLPPPPLFLKN